jgi:hypothetical protein
MCHCCPQIAPSGAVHALENATIDLKMIDAEIDEYLDYFLTIENEYREACMHYHCTQLQARQPSANYPQDRLTSLRELFEITEVKKYDVIFAPLKDIMSALIGLRYKYIRYSGTAEELTHRVYHEIEPAYRALMEEFAIFSKEFYTKTNAAQTLFDLSRAMYETDETGRRCAWQDCDGIDPMRCPMPRIMGEEWERYCNWVGSLPETQRAVEIGRGVSEVANDLLYREPEGFEN